jgi:tetratricopeptide (TPR) repeat protein
MLAKLSPLAIALSLVLLASPAVADDGKDCEQEADPDLAIKGCSALLARPVNDSVAYKNRSVAYNNRGRAYGLKEQYDRAIADLDAAIRVDPTNALAYNNRGLAYDAKGEHDRAIANLSEAIRLDPEYGAAYHNRGNVYQAKGECHRAAADFNEAIRLNPELESPVLSC